MSPRRNIGKSKLWLLLVLPVLFALNWLGSVYHSRIDLTNEKRFTLSAPTKRLLKKLDDVAEVKIFLKGDFPSGFKKLANSTDELLREFKEVAGNKFRYSFVSPDEEMEDTNVKWGDTLSAMGLYPINLKSQLKAGEQQQLVYPVALMRYHDNVIPIRLYNGLPNIGRSEINSAEALMEFEFANALDQLTQNEKPMVAYATGNGEPPIGSYANYDLVETVLRPNYNLFQFNLVTQPLIPDTFKVLMIVKPLQSFSDAEKLKIDQFVMRGGKLLLFLDQLAAEMDSLRVKNEVVAYDRNLGLNDLLFKYGVRVNPDLVMDLQSDRLPFDVNGNGQYEFLFWNYFPVFTSQSNHAINKNLGFVAGKFVNSIDTLEVEGIKKTILLASSDNARKIGTPALISGKENVNAPQNEKFITKNIPVAVLLEGKFASLYNNRLTQEMADSLAKYGATFRSQNATDNKMIVVADGDLVLNAMSKNEPIPMGMNPFTMESQYEFQFANRDFLKNCLDYLVDRSGLAELKAKDYTLRLLDTKKLEQQRTTWQVINIVAPVLLIILFAVIFQWLRKRKYTK